MLLRQAAQRAIRRGVMPEMRIVFDFDGTITQNDTIDELARAAIRLQHQRSGRDLTPAWDRAVQAYLKDYESYKTNFKPSEADRRDAQSEKKFLAGLKDAEEASLSRVSESGIFAGLQRDDLFQMGLEAVNSKRVNMTSGFKDFLLAARQKDFNVDVISVNWSRTFIEGALHPHQLQVTANDVSDEGHIRGPQSLGSRVTTSPDKLKVLRQITQIDQQVVYFGDSITDLECLLYDHGVVMARDGTSSLLKTLSRIGIDVPHIGKGPWNRGGTKISWARDFEEVFQSGILDR